MSTKFYTEGEIRESIEAFLGDWVDEYDVDAIFDEAYEYKIITEECEGGLRVVGEGYQAKPEYDDDNLEVQDSFWDMIENYKIDQNEEDEETEQQDEEETAPQLQNPFLDMLQTEVLPDQK